MFRSPRQAPTYLSETASFKQYLDYYTQRAGLTEKQKLLNIELRPLEEVRYDESE